MHGSGTTKSLWMATASWPDAPDTLPEAGEPRSESGLDFGKATTFAPASLVNREAPEDVVVVGAGIAGLTTAYLLAKEGRQVTVLERRQVGGGETSRTTAHLAWAIDDRFDFLMKQHGPSGARLAAESHRAAIDAIGRIAAEESIACDYRRLDGWLILAPEDKPRLLEDELEACRQLGFAEVTMDREFHWPGGQRAPALRFPDQGQFDPMKYLDGLARAIRARGGRIVAGQAVTHIEGGEVATLHFADGRALQARACVVATNSPIVDKVSIHTKQAPYRTYAVALQVPRGSLQPALWWDTPEIYHYVRLQAAADGTGDDLLIVGGEDHKAGEAHDMAERFLRLEDWARARFPMAGDAAFRWSGQVMEPFDGLGFIGRDPANTANILIATGDSGMGMTHGTIAGLLLTDLLQGRDNPWAGLYDPSRQMTRNLREYLTENLDVAREFVSGRFGSGERAGSAGLAPGQGAVIAEGGRKVAVSRAEDGRLLRVSAVCTHLGCVVRWNDLERSWDCPCHGSRFTADGQVLNGPAVHGLEALDAEAAPAQRPA